MSISVTLSFSFDQEHALDLVRNRLECVSDEDLRDNGGTYETYEVTYDFTLDFGSDFDQFFEDGGPEDALSSLLTGSNPDSPEPWVAEELTTTMRRVEADSEDKRIVLRESVDRVSEVSV